MLLEKLVGVIKVMRSHSQVMLMNAEMLFIYFAIILFIGIGKFIRCIFNSLRSQILAFYSYY